MSYLATIAVGIGGSSVVLDWITHGWYGFYVWKLPSEHQVNGGSYLGFFTDDLLVPLAIALVVGAIGLLALHSGDHPVSCSMRWSAATVLAAAYSARLHTGGYDNVLLPAYTEIAVLFAIGVDRLLRQPKRAWLGALVAVLCLLQFGHLWYSPTAQIPNHTDVALGDDTLAALRALPKPIYLPGHPWYLHEIGQPTNSQAAAIGDVLRAGGDEGRKMAADLWEMVREQSTRRSSSTQPPGTRTCPTTCVATTSPRTRCCRTARSPTRSRARSPGRQRCGSGARSRPIETATRSATGRSARMTDTAATPPEGWAVVDGKLHRELEFHDFVEAFGFMAMVAVAGREGQPSSQLVERLQQGRDRPLLARQGCDHRP